MTEIRISSTELARSIGEILGRLRFRGDSFIIERNGRPIARLTSYAAEQHRGLRETLRAWVEAGPQDEELADLLDEVGRHDELPENPWEPR